jgi:hypothetical protein
MVNDRAHNTVLNFLAIKIGQANDELGSVTLGACSRINVLSVMPQFWCITRYLKI